MSSQDERPPDKRGKWDNAVFTQPGKKPTQSLSPEEGCFSVLAGVGILLVALIFWGIYYWWSEPIFHPERQQPPMARPIRKDRPADFPKINP
jgi:hypothetical protein